MTAQRPPAFYFQQPRVSVPATGESMAGEHHLPLRNRPSTDGDTKLPAGNEKALPGD
jgi:hypothetical protein